jgi:uncharacterized membrane protein
MKESLIVNRKLLWIMIGVVIVVSAITIIGLHQHCMRQCMANFEGPYPEIACKYECGFFNKFRQPTKRP